MQWQASQRKVEAHKGLKYRYQQLFRKNWLELRKRRRRNICQEKALLSMKRLEQRAMTRSKLNVEKLGPERSKPRQRRSI